MLNEVKYLNPRILSGVEFISRVSEKGLNAKTQRRKGLKGDKLLFASLCLCVPLKNGHQISLLLLFSLLFSISYSQNGPAQPNVLLIMVDDLNDCIEQMGGHAQALTPNMTRLAQSGVSFRRAYTNAPMCGPSRACLFTGVYPHHSNNYFQAPWFQNEVLNNTRTMMEQFKEAGYHVMGTGKIMHHNKTELWTHFENFADYGPSPFNGEERVPHPDVPAPFSEIGWVDGSLGPFVNLAGRNTEDGKALSWTTGDQHHGYTPMRYVNDEDRSPTPDERNARWTAEQIRSFSQEAQDQPFFLAVGFLRPHTPLVAPQKYFDRFPLDELELAVIKPGDSSDTHLALAYQGDVFTLKMGARMHEAIAKAYGSTEEGLKRWTQAYLACVAAVDDNIGEVLDALEQSSLRENTIVILSSDHGFHMGEKDYLYKNSLWEESTRIPFMMRVPGLTPAGQTVEAPISLVDLYPTLVDLCGLSEQTTKNESGHSLDGYSFLRLLAKPNAKKWPGARPALSVVFAGSASQNDPTRQHYAIRTGRYRYILYNTGHEELYDHKKDPYEWANLAGLKGRNKRILKRMREELKGMLAPHELVGFERLKIE
jgi:arylsulfatase A-like enzyme